MMSSIPYFDVLTPGELPVHNNVSSAFSNTVNGIKKTNRHSLEKKLNKVPVPSDRTSVSQPDGKCVQGNCDAPNLKVVTFPSLVYKGVRCLPASKGSIKKTAQTRFVNSSPRSYRLMPASIESSDKTSFIEKLPYRLELRVSYMLAVADLWKISTRSELECKFTSANSENDGGVLVSSSNRKRSSGARPICHSSVHPPKIPCPWASTSHCTNNQINNEKRMKDEDIVIGLQSASLGLDTNLLKDAKRFLKNHNLNQMHPMGIAGFLKPSSSDEQPTNFAISSRGATTTVHSTKITDLMAASSSSNLLVNNIALSSQISTIPLSLNTVEDLTATTSKDKEPPEKRMKEAPKPSYECFYCSEVFSDRNLCAIHMQKHLAS